MKKKICLLALIMPFVLLISSCDDNSTNVPVGNASQFMPLKVGNYWIYKAYRLNSVSDTISETLWYDSLAVVSENTDYFQNTTYVLIAYKNNVPYDTMHLITANTQLNWIIDESDSLFKGMTDQWVTLADFGSNDWHIYDTTIQNYNYYFNGKHVSSKLNIAINGYSEGKIEYNFGSKVYTARKFRYKTDQLYQLKTTFNPSNDSITIKRQFLSTEYFYFAEGLGIVRRKLDSYNLKTTESPDSPYYAATDTLIQGYYRELIRCNIQQ
jgi:hypothetical protein